MGQESLVISGSIYNFGALRQLLFFIEFDAANDKARKRKI